MSNEPKADMNIDPEMLAAYIDNRLTPEQRAEVEAQLARDPDSYAVLVETLKALEQVTDVRTVPGSPKGVVAGARRWTVAAGLLAAAAAVVLVVRLNHGSDAPELARLIAAVSSERPIEARLTGGFAYARVAPVTRGLSELAARNLALVASAAELQRRVAENPTYQNRKAWAAAQMLTGQAEAATDTLAQLSKEAPKDAAIHSDLSAALLARVALGEAAQLAPALEHATVATRLAPALAEAAFNRALALEAASLVSQALDEWRRCLKLERESGWRAEAESHIQDLERRVAPKPSAGVPSSTKELLRWASGRSVMESTPEWRAALEGPILVDLLQFQSEEGWTAGLRFADEFSRHTGDQLPRAIWQHAHDYPQRELLRGGLDAYLSALALLDNNELTRASQQFDRADRLLRHTASPAAMWTQYYQAHCEFFTGQTQSSMNRLAVVVNESTRLNALSVEVRALYLLGLGKLRLGEHAAVIDIQRRTAELAVRVGVRTTEIQARSEVADALMRLSISNAAWIERLRALEVSQRLNDPAVRHVVTVGAARAAATEGLTNAAEAFATAALENGQQWKNFAAQAEARMRLADVFDRRNEPHQALALLQHAERDLAALPDSVFADGWRADLEIARGSAALATSPTEAHAASERAFQILARRYSPFREARARWVQGMSLVHSDSVRARQSFIAGLLATEKEGAGADPFGRSLADQRWILLRSLIALPSHSVDAGLRDVWGALLGHTASDSLWSVQERLQPDDLVLVFAALDDRLVRWHVTAAAIERRDIRVSQHELADLVDRQRARISDPRSSDWAVPTTALSRILFEGLSTQPPARLLVVTDGVTSRVAFGVLQWPAASEPLVASVDLAILASDESSSSAKVVNADLHALVVGSTANSLSSFLAPLPGALDEARQVADLYDKPTVMIGPSAVRQKLLDELPKSDVFHFAGHAIGDRSDPGASRLLLSENTEVTAQDIVRLRLRARVVVLGSCQGALSATAGNVPAYGLARAFLNAGARAVVASQWDVDDRVAIAMMTDLHRKLVAATAPARAVREIQDRIRRESRFSHPYFWAGFGVYTRLVSHEGVTE